MKTKVKTPKMKPISVVIEKPNELHELCSVLANCDWDMYPSAKQLWDSICIYTSIYPKEEDIDNESKET